MKGGRFATIEEINLHRCKSSRVYQKVLRGLEKALTQFNISEWDYFEGENIDIDE